MVVDTRISEPLNVQPLRASLYTDSNWASFGAPVKPGGSKHRNADANGKRFLRICLL
jgi:hypothetical protein